MFVKIATDNTNTAGINYKNYEGISKSFRTFFFVTLFIKYFKNKLRHFSI
jgi:phosphate starvation-inducible membrane PsiE